MNRAEAYAILSREPGVWRARTYDRLVGCVGRPAASRIVRIGQEDVTVTVEVSWADERKRSLRIAATADGPSCWRLERLEETVEVGPST